MTIGEKIRALREGSDLTLNELGEAVDFNYSNLSKIERGLRPASIELLETLADYFNVDVTYFFDAKKIETPVQLEKYIEWLAFADDMEKRNLTPKEIKDIIDFLHKRMR